MRKAAVILPLVIMSALSCRHDAPEAVPFTLAPQTEALTKAGTPLSASYTIWCSAHITDPASPANDIDYFTGEPFRRSGDGSWRPDAPMAWPFSGSLSLMTIAAEDPQTGSWIGWREGSCASSAEVAVPDGAALRDDLLWGVATGQNTHDHGVPVTLHHSQAWLEFVLSSEQGGILRIEGVDILDCYSGGTLRVTSGITPQAEWDYTGHSEGTVTVPGTSGVILGTAGQTFSVKVPRQHRHAIRIRYKVRDGASASFDLSQERTFEISGSNEWLPGVIYTFDIRTDISQRSVSVTLEAFGERTVHFIPLFES